jgi:hypothetical protein
MKKLIIILIIITTNLFSQEYEIAWEKDIGGTYAQFSKDGEFIYVAGGNTISKYRSSDGSFVSTFDNAGLQKISEFYSLCISKNDTYAIARLGDQEGTLNLYDVKTEKALKQYKGIKWSEIMPDEKSILCIKDIGGDSRKIVVIDINSEKELKSVNSDIWQGYLKLSHNGKMFATASISGTKYYFTLWDTETLTEIKRFELIDNETGTTFFQIKFSWDDNFVGISRSLPYISNIYSIPKLIEITNSKNYDKWLCSFFDFSQNQIFFHYTDISIDTTSLVSININNMKIDQRFHLQVLPLTSSFNNLIFTGSALLKPKTVGVSENEQKRLLISPNPASDYIEINVGAGSKPALENPGIEIYNLFGEKNPTLSLPIGEGTGKILPTGEDLGGVFKIDVSNLAPGVYFIKIGDIFEKFVKM